MTQALAPKTQCDRDKKVDANSKTNPNASIVHGDAYALAGTLAKNSVDLIVTSPPYWGLRNYGLPHDETVLDRWLELGIAGVPTYDWYRDTGGVLGLEPYPEWYVSHLVEIFERLRGSLTDHASVWVNLGDTYFARWSSIRDCGRQGLGEGERRRRRTPTGGYLHDKQLLLVPSRFAIAMQDAGWVLRNDVIWSKGNVEPRRPKDRLRASHEHFFHFVQRTRGSRPTYFYNADAVEPGACDVVGYSSRQSAPGHSATFPEQLVEARILSCSPPGGLVLDPFCGTGTAVVVAARCGRRGLGFDLAAKHAQAAADRAACLPLGEPTLLTGEGGAMPLRDSGGAIATALALVRPHGDHQNP